MLLSVRSIDVEDLAAELHRPLDELSLLLRRFLYTQIYPDEDLPVADVDVDDLPFLSNFAMIGIFKCARTAFYSPSEEAGPWGMHAEVIRCNPSWYRQHERRDTMLVQVGADDDVMGGLLIARVVRFIRIKYEDIEYPSALIEWFLPVGHQPDAVTGMWVVEPELDDTGRRTLDIINLDAVFRSCHLIGVTGQDFLPLDFDYSFSLDAFDSFYLNRYSDYHMHECGPR